MSGKCVVIIPEVDLKNHLLTDNEGKYSLTRFICPDCIKDEEELLNWGKKFI
jgi:hypothetical protein